MTESISWNLQKCGGDLRVTDLKFADMKFPNWDDWREITEQVGTIDGNWVRITATVFNASADRRSAEVMFKETYQGDKWDGAKPDQPLKDQVVLVTLDPGEARDVEILWDSSGYAWYDDGRPRLVQRVKTELWEKNKRAADMTKNLKVAPKPVVLVHGAWSHWKQFETWQNILTTTHSYDWKAFPVGEVTNKGILNTGRDFFSSEETNSTPQNAAVLKNYIKYAQEDRNAWHVDVVAHGVGGLIGRYYISNLMPAAYADARPQISHLVMLGTPNLGSPCADVMDFAFDMTGKSPRVVRQMRQDTMVTFNTENANRRGVKFSALAGNPLPTMCKTIVWNDGFVPVPSAHWTIADHALSKNVHPDLTGTEDFSQFVKPRLAIGPRGDHNPEVQGARNERSDASRYFMYAAYQPRLASLPAGDELKPDFAKAVTVAPKQTLDVAVPVLAANNFGVTFMAAPDLSVTLYDDKGNVVGKNLAKHGGRPRHVPLDLRRQAGVGRHLETATREHVSPGAGGGHRRLEECGRSRAQAAGSWRRTEVGRTGAPRSNQVDPALLGRFGSLTTAWSPSFWASLSSSASNSPAERSSRWRIFGGSVPRWRARARRSIS